MAEFGYQDRFNYDIHRPDLDLIERKRRQQLRESNVEIRDLEAKLRQARINKQVAEQIKQKELSSALQKEQEVAESKHFEALRLQALEEEKIQEQNERIERLKFQQRLDAQMEYKQGEEKVAYENFLKEKKMIDEIIAKVKEEERKKILDDMHKRQVEKETIREFIEAQKIWVIKDRERVDKENREIARFIEDKDRWKVQVAEDAKERRAIKNQEVLKLGEEIEVRRKEEEEKRTLMHELHEGRMKEVEEKVDQEEMEREIRRRLQLKESNELAIECRRRQKEKEMKEEEAWRAKMLIEMEKEARIEQMNDQRRRMKQQELKRAAAVLLEERRKARDAEKKQDQEYWKAQKEVEAINLEMVEKERKKLLKEAASSRLIEFLPSGVLQEEDLEMLGREVDPTLMYRMKKDSQQRKDPLAELEQFYSSRNPKGSANNYINKT